MTPAPVRYGAGARAYALALGIVCHLAFAAAVLAMMAGLWSGMALGRGRLPQPWGWAANAALLAQFVVAHSWLLTRRGGRALAAAAPSGAGGALASTSYATLASLQVLALFLLWTPNGVVWARVEGAPRLALLALDAFGWLLLLKAIVDAGLGLQTGALGWRAVRRGAAPVYPPMPERGLFTRIRQPIYLAFAIVTWATPTWTPDQFAVALTLSGYCLLGPRLKEARFRRRFGERFDAYQAATPYWIPRLRRPTTR